MPWFLDKPAVNADTNDFIFKRWFDQIYRFCVGEANGANSTTASANVDEAFFYPVDCTAGAVTITLPPAASYGFKKYVIKKTDVSANAVTIAVNGTDTIESAATLSLTTQYDWVILYSDSITTWWKLASQVGGPSSAGGITRGIVIDLMNIPVFF